MLATATVRFLTSSFSKWWHLFEFSLFVLHWQETSTQQNYHLLFRFISNTKHRNSVSASSKPADWSRSNFAEILKSLVRLSYDFAGLTNNKHVFPVLVATFSLAPITFLSLNLNYISSILRHLYLSLSIPSHLVLLLRFFLFFFFCAWSELWPLSPTLITSGQHRQSTDMTHHHHYPSLFARLLGRPTQSFIHHHLLPSSGVHSSAREKEGNYFFVVWRFRCWVHSHHLGRHRQHTRIFSHFFLHHHPWSWPRPAICDLALASVHTIILRLSSSLFTPNSYSDRHDHSFFLFFFVFQTRQHFDCKIQLLSISQPTQTHDQLITTNKNHMSVGFSLFKLFKFYWRFVHRSIIHRRSIASLFLYTIVRSPSDLTLLINCNHTNTIDIHIPSFVCIYSFFYVFYSFLLVFFFVFVRTGSVPISLSFVFINLHTDRLWFTDYCPEYFLFGYHLHKHTQNHRRPS